MDRCKDKGLLLGKGGLFGNVMRVAPSLTINANRWTRCCRPWTKSYTTCREGEPIAEHSPAAGELAIDASLSNPDIAPVPQSGRNWTAFSFYALWVGMAINIPTYMIAASLIDNGMSWQQATWTVLLGNVIVLIPMMLSGHAGTKYGIPFPVFARASFGIRGAHIPAMLRAIVACGWFGIQTWIGGAAIYTIVLIVYPGAENLPMVLPEFIGIGIVQFLCFMVFWAMNIYLIYKGIDSIKVLEMLAAPFLILCGLALLGWAYASADGFGPMLEATSKFETSAQFWKLFFPSLTAMVGFLVDLVPEHFRFHALLERSARAGDRPDQRPAHHHDAVCLYRRGGDQRDHRDLRRGDLGSGGAGASLRFADAGVLFHDRGGHRDHLDQCRRQRRGAGQ